MKILFVTSEAYPFAMSGGLADVSAALPKALCARNVACRVVMPLYGSISEEQRKGMKFVCSFTPLPCRCRGDGSTAVFMRQRWAG